jgi:hypothetical protein
MMVRQVLKRSCLLGSLAAIAVLGFAGSASAHTGVWEKFNYCPSTTTGVFKCLYSVTNGGYITLGTKKTPIVNPVTLQGGFFGDEQGKKTYFDVLRGDERRDAVENATAGAGRTRRPGQLRRNH